MNPHPTLIELEQNIEKLTNIYKTNAAKLSRQSSLDFNEYTVNPLLRAMQELLKEYRARYDQHREQINELEKQLATPQPITREMLKRIEQEHSHKYENAPPEPCSFEELVGEPMKEQVTWTINNIIYRKADVSDIGKMVYFTNVNIDNALQNPKHELINVDHNQRFPYLADTNIGYTKAYIELNPKINHAEFMQQVIEEMESPETITQFAPTMNQEPKKSDIEILNTLNEILKQPEQTKFSTGAVRSTDANSTRYDLISPVGLRRIAETYAEGAKKYGDNNWTKGMPASDTMNHAIRHLNLWLSGDKTEDHLAHAAWNLIAIMHFEELKPECIDVPTRRTT